MAVDRGIGSASTGAHARGSATASRPQRWSPHSRSPAVLATALQAAGRRAAAQGSGGVVPDCRWQLCLDLGRRWTGKGGGQQRYNFFFLYFCVCVTLKCELHTLVAFSCCELQIPQDTLLASGSSSNPSTCESTPLRLHYRYVSRLQFDLNMFVYSL